MQVEVTLKNGIGLQKQGLADLRLTCRAHRR